MIPKNTVILLRGCPGSGKSYLCNELSQDLQYVDVHSTDRYFLRPCGHYSWCVQDLGRAHKWNQDNFSHSIWPGNDDPPLYVIVDNTNITWKDCKFYIENAAVLGWNIILWEPDGIFTAEELFKRNTHNVPLKTIQNMMSKWQSSQEIIDLATQQFVRINISTRKGLA